MPRAWVLNFDAEYELEARGRYTPTGAMRAQVRALTAQVAKTLPQGDLVIDPDAPRDASWFEPRAWSPTPRAIALLRAAGLALEGAPSLETLARVNERGFAFALADPDELPGALRAITIEQVEAHVASPGPTGEWLLKRAFAVAGRGQRPVHPGALSTEDRAFVAASIARHGAIHVEPRVSIARELSVHGWVEDRRVRLTSIREQELARGAFVGSRRVDDALPASTRDPLEATASRVGAALAAAGYHGPFGVDAYEWEHGGVRRLRTLSEINARYCMGWDDEDGW